VHIQRNIPESRTPSLFSKWKCIAVPLALLLWLTSSAWASDSLNNQLNSDYAGKVLTLRRFYGGEHLSFHSDGSLKTSAPVGPWTLDAQIEVQKIELHGDLLIIKGRRIHRIFDAQLKPLDELTTVENPQDKQQKDLEKALRRLKAEIEIELPSERPDEKDVMAAMHAVFLTNSESMVDIVPSYWRAYFAKQEGKPAPPQGNGPMNSFKPRGGMSPPHIAYQSDPEYSDEARKAKHQGTIVLSLAVDASGAPKDLQIVRPLGLGLDEKSIESVSKWTFRPARKDGEPVSVLINVEVNFRLY
jgi:TonB family protein